MITPLQIRAKAREQLSEARKQAHNTLIVHYSCESLDDKDDGRSARITSIAVRKLANGQATSFSLHKEAEKAKVDYAAISQHFDQLEHQMLSAFFDFVNEHRTHTWIHWNMRDANFGFQAINHRFEVLGGKPVEINDSNKLDLSRALSHIYGPKYIGHPRLATLLEKNDISMLDMLTGAMEAQAFKDAHFIALHKSTLRKVCCFEHVIDAVNNDQLKHEGKKWDLYGPGIKGLIPWIKDHPIYTAIGFFTTAFAVVKIGMWLMGKAD